MECKAAVERGACRARYQEAAVEPGRETKRIVADGGLAACYLISGSERHFSNRQQSLSSQPQPDDYHRTDKAKIPQGDEMLVQAVAQRENDQVCPEDERNEASYPGTEKTEVFQ